MTDKITLELTLDELKLIDKYVELNDETQSVFDKIKVAYPQPRMNLRQEGEYAVVSYQDKTYYRLQGDVTFSWYIKKGVNVGYPVPTLMMVNDAETERLLEGIYYNHIQVKKEKEQQKEEKVEPSMINCVILGNPPDGYGAWSEWYNEMGSKGILHNLKISSKEYQPKNEWKSVALRFGEKLPVILPYGYDELSPNAWYRWVVFNYDNYIKQRDIESGYHSTPQTPEQTEQSLKEAFVKAQQTEKWKEIQKLIDEEDNDKNFKNSLELIKEWGEKNKPKTLYQIFIEWWDEDWGNAKEICIDKIIDKIDKEFIPPSSERNTYEWNKCLELMRGKLR